MRSIVFALIAFVICLAGVSLWTESATAWDVQVHYTNETGNRAFDLSTSIKEFVTIDEAIAGSPFPFWQTWHSNPTDGSTWIEWYGSVVEPGSGAAGCFNWSSSTYSRISIVGTTWSDTSGIAMGDAGANLGGGFSIASEFFEQVEGTVVIQNDWIPQFRGRETIAVSDVKWALSDTDRSFEDLIDVHSDTSVGWNDLPDFSVAYEASHTIDVVAVPPSVHYGWEDGAATVLGMFGTGFPPINADHALDPVQLWEGMTYVLFSFQSALPNGDLPVINTWEYPVEISNLYSLRLEDNSPSGTPQVFIAWITDLSDGDLVEAGVWRYDDTPGASPSCRVWGHWNDDPDDVNGYDGTAGGNYDYGPGAGWDQTSHTWTVDGGHTGLVVEIRTYSSPGDVVWIDDLVITAPPHATVHFPNEGSSIVRPASWGQIKSLFR